MSQQATGTMAWFDIPTQDLDKAIAFYKAVLAWEPQPMSPGYLMVKAGGETIGALRKEVGADFHATRGMVSYFTVPSITEAKALATKNGGTLVGETVNIGEQGYFQLFKDLDGNQLSFWSMKP